LGRYAARHPWFFLAAWTLLVAAAAGGARKAPSLLFGGSGDIPGSPPERADSLLRAGFDNPYSQLLVLAVRGLDAAGRVDDREGGPAADAADRLKKALTALPQVAGVMTPETVLDKRLLPPPGEGMMILIGVKAGSVREAEQAIPVVRKASDSVLSSIAPSHPGLRWAVTGRSAFTYDINHFNAKDSAEAEARAIPLTLLVLLFAFGSVVAAGVPALLGFLSTVVSMGLVFLLARHWVLSNLVQNVTSMIGLAVGIDYSLLIIHRYRQALARIRESGASAGTDGADGTARALALEEAMGTAGRAVFLSGLTVMIGFAGMLFTPLMETRSIGWGGCIVVLVSMAVALTFLPSLLVVLGKSLDWPAALSRRLAGGKRGRRWEAWSHRVMDDAPWFAAASLAALLLLAYPGRYTEFGFPEGKFIPERLEFSRGLRMLDSMGMAGLVRPINLILTAKDGGPALTPARIDSLCAFSARIRKDPAVGRVFGPVDLSDDWPTAKYRAFYADVPEALERAPFIKDLFLSRDGRSLLMQVLIRPEAGLEREKALAKDIPRWFGLAGMDLGEGGQAVYYNDFDKAMKAAYAPCLTFVLAVTFVSMLLFFRSPLVSFKALAMNALSVLAGYGAVVYVFQLGHGDGFFGSPGPTEVVPMTLPLMLFCILFGLSMDYEIFLLSRIREHFLRTGDNRGSIAEGLADTGPMITSAALIMTAVFGAFAFADMVVVQMLGLGLATAVLVDATLIRVLLVPAFMKLAGKWNWWPMGEARRPETRK
jgi:RND superfamily putative drug exporter